MLMTIDVGNTNTVFSLHDGHRFLSEWRIATNGGRTSDEYIVWLEQLLRLSKLSREQVTGVILASVAPQTMFNLKRLSTQYFGCEAMVVGEKNCYLDVDIQVDSPADVGADRLVNVVSGRERYGNNLIILDFGTATTFDVVGPDGAYLGGVIAPGVNLSVEALYMAAAKLPRISVERPMKVVGGDTISAMQSGIYWGYVAMVDGMIARIQAEQKQEMTVIATGGLSGLFSQGTTTIQHVDVNLTMRGLVQIYQQNQNKTKHSI